MAAQMKQLEQRLMALRAQLREKENKARQAEGSVQDLKLQLDDLQVCNLPVMLVIAQKAKGAHTAYVGQHCTVCTVYTVLLRGMMHEPQQPLQRGLAAAERLPLEHGGLSGETV